MDRKHPDFFKNTINTRNIPGNVAGHVFRYTAVLVSVNAQVVSVMESNYFTLL